MIAISLDKSSNSAKNMRDGGTKNSGYRVRTAVFKFNGASAARERTAEYVCKAKSTNVLRKFKNYQIYWSLIGCV